MAISVFQVQSPLSQVTRERTNEYLKTVGSAVGEELVRVAEKNDIPYQLEVMGGRTGTNLDGMTTERGGIKSALISIPQKYMHTGIEVVSVTDIELCARLIAAYILGGDLNA